MKEFALKYGYALLGLVVGTAAVGCALLFPDMHKECLTAAVVAVALGTSITITTNMS